MVSVNSDQAISKSRLPPPFQPPAASRLDSIARYFRWERNSHGAERPRKAQSSRRSPAVLVTLITVAPPIGGDALEHDPGTVGGGDRGLEAAAQHEVLNAEVAGAAEGQRRAAAARRDDQLEPPRVGLSAVAGPVGVEAGEPRVGEADVDPVRLGVVPHRRAAVDPDALAHVGQPARGRAALLALGGGNRLDPGPVRVVGAQVAEELDAQERDHRVGEVALDVGRGLLRHRLDFGERLCRHELAARAAGGGDPRAGGSS